MQGIYTTAEQTASLQDNILFCKFELHFPVSIRINYSKKAGKCFFLGAG